MPRFIFILVVFGVAFLLTRLVMSTIASKQCPNCNGQGYWKDTRGDRNFCKACDGTGQKD